MTKQQHEVSRKLYDIGCTFQYDESQKRLFIQKDGEDICSLGDNGSCYSPPDVSLSDKQEEVYRNVEKLIDNAREYITTYENAKPFEIEGITDYLKLSEFNGVVFGAKDCGDYGFQFSSWFKTYNGTGATMGKYSFDYETSKQAFAERSGLVDRHRQFSNEQLENLYRCLAFTKNANNDLTYEQDKTIGDLIDKLEYVLPYLKDNPNYLCSPSDDGGITLN